MKLNRDGKQFFIYALVCPLTLEVKYVGQTIDLNQRTRGAHGGSTRYNGPLTAWFRTLGYLRPYRVILERGINRRVTLPQNGAILRGRKRVRPSVWLSSCLEAKWIKRFRRTIVNKNTGVPDVAAMLTNPPFPWEERE